jgi:hypothetical protein
MWNWLKKLRGALGNAVLWAGIWSLGTIPVLGILQLLGFRHVFPLTGLLHVAPRIAVSLAAMGFIAGGAFSTYLGLSPRKRLEELDLRTLGVVGVLFGAAMVPIFGWLPTVISALGPSLPVVFGVGAAVAGVLGGATAVGSVKIARAALTAGDDSAPRLGAHSTDPGEDRKPASGLLESDGRS